MRRIVILALALSCFGCGAMTLRTDSKVTVANPLLAEATLHVASDRPSSHGPVIEMPVGAAASGCAKKIAIIDVDGLLVNQNRDGALEGGDNPVAIFEEKLNAAHRDSGVCAIVVRINSPGGGVTGSDIMWQRLHRFRSDTNRPVVACVLDVGAGGAYYVATAADRIIAHPTSLTGGIGVIWNGYNLRDLMAQFNILSQSIKSGPHIDLGAPTRNLTPEAKKILQDIADEFHQRFKAIVCKARPQVDPKLASNFDGQVFTSGQALKRGLVDSVGYLDDAIATARALAHEPGADVVLYRRRNDPAHSTLAVSGNMHTTESLLPLHVPGLQRSRLPTFLYLWQPEPSLDR